MLRHSFRDFLSVHHENINRTQKMDSDADEPRINFNPDHPVFKPMQKALVEKLKQLGDSTEMETAYDIFATSTHVYQ